MSKYRGSVSGLTEIFQVDERRGPDDVLGHVSMASSKGVQDLAIENS
jgi:hypothetical protein